MRINKFISSIAAATMLTASVAYAENLTIATVNNGDMIRMQGLTDDFTAKTGHTVEWVTLEENVLRQRVTTDITTKGGAFDIMTIGMYETPIWGSNGWLVPLDDLSADYNVGDLLLQWLVVYHMMVLYMLHLSTARAQWLCTELT